MRLTHTVTVLLILCACVLLAPALLLMTAEALDVGIFDIHVEGRAVDVGGLRRTSLAGGIGVAGAAAISAILTTASDSRRSQR